MLLSSVVQKLNSNDCGSCRSATVVQQIGGQRPTALKTEDDDGSAQSVRYLALDGYQGGADTVGWSNLAFVPLLVRGSHPWDWGLNETLLQSRLDQGFDVLLDVAGITVYSCIWSTNSDAVRAVAAAPKQRFLPRPRQQRHTQRQPQRQQKAAPASCSIVRCAAPNTCPGSPSWTNGSACNIGNCTESTPVPKHGRCYIGINMGSKCCLPNVMKGACVNPSTNRTIRYLCPGNQPDGPVGDSTRFCNVSNNECMPPPSPCELKWRAAWYGPNSSTGGVWNSTVKRIAAMAPHQSNRGRLLGYYVGDELLAQGLSVSSLAAVFDLLKQT